MEPAIADHPHREPQLNVIPDYREFGKFLHPAGEWSGMDLKRERANR
jgi:hypothetical protein